MYEAASELGRIELRVEAPAPGTVVLSVAGEADLHVAPELRDAIASVVEEGASGLVIDLSATTFVDSMALGVLLGAMKRTRERGARMCLVAPRAEVRRVFEITLLDRVLPLYETREEALRAAGPGAADGA